MELDAVDPASIRLYPRSWGDIPVLLPGLLQDCGGVEARAKLFRCSSGIGLVRRKLASMAGTAVGLLCWRLNSRRRLIAGIEHFLGHVWR